MEGFASVAATKVLIGSSPRSSINGSSTDNESPLLFASTLSAPLLGPVWVPGSFAGFHFGFGFSKPDFHQSQLSQVLGWGHIESQSSRCGSDYLDSDFYLSLMQLWYGCVQRQSINIVRSCQQQKTTKRVYMTETESTKLLLSQTPQLDLRELVH